MSDTIIEIIGKRGKNINANVDISNVFLETDRLILRPWRKEDVKDFNEYARVDGVGQMAGWNPHTSMEESKKILEMFIDEKKTFAIELKENHKVIGSLGLEELSDEINETYDNLTGREIGYVLSKDYWGRGLVPEAVKRVIEYCFKDEKYDYLLCGHFSFNQQSKRVIEKCGFRYVKEMEVVTLTGQKHDTLLYVLDNPERVQ